MRDGDRLRPLGISIDVRLFVEERLLDVVVMEEDFGTSRMLRRRPVVGSFVEEVEGS